MLFRSINYNISVSFVSKNVFYINTKKNNFLALDQ